MFSKKRYHCILTQELIMKEEQTILVDQQQIKFNMAMTATLLAVGYLLSNWIPVAIAIVCQFSGGLGLSISPYRLLYIGLVLPTGLLKPKKIPDNHAPHRFAAFIGGLFDLIGIILIIMGFEIVGWIFIGIVFVLSILNLFLGFCAGCFMYYIMNKFGVPGFGHSPVQK
jgi:hypothetical protein